MVFLVTLSGCSSVKKISIIDNGRNNFNGISYAELENFNITNNNFIIRRADIEILSKGQRKKLIATVKYRKEGICLISIRNITGIEAARIYLTRDSIRVNDRIGRRTYVISKEYLSGRYGFSGETIPLIFGDLILQDHERTLECKDDKAVVNSGEEGKNLRYQVDCKGGKATQCIIQGGYENENIIFKFDKFRNSEGYTYPSIISTADSKGDTVIEVKIGDIEFVTDLIIEFVPGNNYEKIILE